MSQSNLINIFELGRQANLGLDRSVTYRADGTLLISLGQDQPEFTRSKDESRGVPLQAAAIHYHPLKSQSWQQVLTQLKHLSQQNLPIHGLSPRWLTAHQAQGNLEAQLSEAGLASFSLSTGEFNSSNEWLAFKDWSMAMVASFVYTPETSQSQIEERVQQLSQFKNIQSIVVLPVGLGDRVIVNALTTEGGFDAEIQAWTQIAIQKYFKTVTKPRVRASWGSVGWKMAQPTLAFGCNELAGWGIEEVITYGPKSRPHSWIGEEEVIQGILEAGRQPQRLLQRAAV
jgi:hypothetical protein